MKPSVSFATAVTLWTIGCGAGGRALTDAGLPANPLEVGTGSSSFVVLHDGDEVPIITGPQGGHHIWGALRVSTPLSPTLDLHYRILLADGGAEISDNPYHLTLIANGPYNERYGLIGLLPEPSGVATVNGTQTILRMEVIDANGTSATDERLVIPRAP